MTPSSPVPHGARILRRELAGCLPEEDAPELEDVSDLDGRHPTAFSSPGSLGTAEGQESESSGGAALAASA